MRVQYLHNTYSYVRMVCKQVERYEPSTNNKKMVAFFVMCQHCMNGNNTQQEAFQPYTKWIIERVGVSRNDGECTIMICIFCRYILLLLLHLQWLGRWVHAKPLNVNSVQNISGTVYCTDFLFVCKRNHTMWISAVHIALKITRFEIYKRKA